MSDQLERKLLSKLTDPEAMTEAWAAGVRAEHFEEPLYQAIWNWTVDYWNQFRRESVPTSWALTEEFAGYSPLEAVGEETIYLCELMQRRFATNRVQDLVRRAAATAATDPLGTAKMLEAEALTLNEITRSRLTEVDMGESIQDRRERYARLSESPQGIGVTYGLDLLDLHTGGIYPGELVMIGAYAKTGKTMFLLNAAAEALRKRLRPVIFSLELSLEDTQTRLDAMWSGLSYSRLQRGHLSMDELKVLHEKQEELRDEYGGLRILRPDEGDRSVGAICARARQLDCNYLIIDQLSKMDATIKWNTTKEKYTSILTQLKNEISRAGAELPCMLAGQTKREGSEEPTIQSFADDANIERECDLALTLWRSADLRNNNMMKANIVASRRTEPAAWLLDWQLSNHTGIRALEEVR